MTNRIIFLDVDGVLDYLEFFKTKTYKRRAKKNQCDMSNMINRYNLFWVGLLCRITGAKVVMSSTWRYGWYADGTVRHDIPGHQMELTDKLFRKYGIKLISITERGDVYLKDKYELDKEAIEKWVAGPSANGLEEVRTEEFILKYARGTQILEWIENHNYHGKYIVIDDDIGDIIFYKDLAKRLVQTSYYGKKGGFRFKHFIKALKLLRSKND